MIKVHQKRGKYKNAATGAYIPQNPSKYLGTYPLIYKSKLEFLCMRYLDTNNLILNWSYEPSCIRYLDKASGKVRRYFIDFVAVARAGNFKKTLWIEVKSEQETKPPKNKKDLKAMATFLTNTCKWEAAQQLAKSKGYEFHILTEAQLK